MTFKQKILSAATVAALFSAPAGAALIDGIVIPAGASFEFALLAEAEAFGDGLGNDNGIIDLAGEQLVGVGRIMTITDGIGNIVWSHLDNGRELTLHFHSYIAENFTFPAANQAIIGFTGGIVELYSDSTPNYEQNGTQADDIAKATDGNLWLSLAGSAIGDAATPERGALSNSPITLESTGAFTLGTILGEGNLDVTGGLAAALLDTNTFNCTSNPAEPAPPCPDIADKVFTSSGQLRAITSGDQWAFLGTADVRDFSVPEPGSLALLGLGLLGLGLTARRNLKV